MSKLQEKSRFSFIFCLVAAVVSLVTGRIIVVKLKESLIISEKIQMNIRIFFKKISKHISTIFECWAISGLFQSL